MAGAKARSGRVILGLTRTAVSLGHQTRVVIAAAGFRAVAAGFRAVAADSAVVVGAGAKCASIECVRVLVRFRTHRARFFVKPVIVVAAVQTK